MTAHAPKSPVLKRRTRKWRGGGVWDDAPMEAPCAACGAANNRGFAVPGALFVEVESTAADGAVSIEMRRVEKRNHGWPSILTCVRSSEAEALAELSGLGIASGKPGAS